MRFLRNLDQLRLCPLGLRNFLLQCFIQGVVCFLVHILPHGFKIVFGGVLFLIVQRFQTFHHRINGCRKFIGKRERRGL